MFIEKNGANSENTPHITVCICTYKRPLLLVHLLHALTRQRTDGALSYSVVVVDNDRGESAEEIVSRVKEGGRLNVEYYCVPEQNISLTRNKTIESSAGELIAFIDDDQFPEEDWLIRLYSAYKRFAADFVLGPIKPHFPSPPPDWIRRGKLFDRTSFPTGTIMNMNDAKHMRTGNVLMRRSVIHDGELAFDPRFGMIGGEDQDFFRRKLAEGFVFVWCEEAVIHETFPPDRFARSYFLRRALRRGSTEAELGKLTALSLCKSMLAVAVYTSLLPILFVTGHHHFMRLLIKDCDHVGKLLGSLGLAPVKAWPIQASQETSS